MRVRKVSGVYGLVLSLALMVPWLVTSQTLRAFARQGSRGESGQQAAPDSPSFFPLSQVHVGLKGIGKTILQGDEITEFQVEVLGVLRGVLAPKHDAILVKLSGGGIERTNIVAGMSGSPVYVEGKLMGAVAVSFPFAKEPYGLVTPIEDMLAVTPSPNSASQAASSTSASAEAPNVSTGPYGLELGQGSAALSAGGFVRVAGGATGDVRFIPGDSLPWLPKADPSIAMAGHDASGMPPG